MMGGHRQEIVITGMGAVSSLGLGCEALWSAVMSGKDGLGPVRRFSTRDFGTEVAALVPGNDDIQDPMTHAFTRTLFLRFATWAAREALSHAGVKTADQEPGRFWLVLGTGLGDSQGRPHPLSQALAEDLGLVGPHITVSTACASSTLAIGMARDLILGGHADRVLAGGADVMTPKVFAGFNALGVLSPGKCAPFGLPFGTTLGEGAGFVVLETEASARGRRKEPIVCVSGFGCSGDAFHETSPDPSGSGIERALRGALGDADLESSAIGYVNAHGSGTEANDQAEWFAIRRVMGEGAARTPVSSSKSFLGHAQGAAGVLELITTVLAMCRRMVPPTMNVTTPRPFGPVDPVAGDRPKPWAYEHAACLNSAFGGANAALVLSHRPRVRNPRPQREVRILGIGTSTRPGDDPMDLISRLVPTADTRGMDRASLYLSAASAMALFDAGITISRSMSPGIGLVVGACRASPSSLEAFEASIRHRGLAACSATSFARIVLNAPAGSGSKLLRLKGPNLTFSTGPGAGLAAIAYAAQLLSDRDDVAALVAGGVDEADDPDPGTAREGAAMAVLSNGQDAVADRPDNGPPIRLGGWAFGKGLVIGDVALKALRGAGMQPAEVDAVFATVPIPGLGRGFVRIGSDVALEAVSGVLGLVDAVRSLWDRSHKTVLVVSGENGTATTALCLTTRGGP